MKGERAVRAHDRVKFRYGRWGAEHEGIVLRVFPNGRAYVEDRYRRRRNISLHDIASVLRPLPEDTGRE
jgi:hypothetical protein